MLTVRYTGRVLTHSGMHRCGLNESMVRSSSGEHVSTVYNTQTQTTMNTPHISMKTTRVVGVVSLW